MIDTIKVVAAQLIVLHHLAWFGPMSDVAASASPLFGSWQGWLAEYGRYAVAAFLAVAGYLAAQSLSPRGLPPDRSPLSLITQRYLRLAGPYAVALLL
ncbi:MAG: acyltransferase family protein, partial [Rhodocyclaceae bacterium]|nr:acyltransferase family protein [Rhodocyclaceae bacterium]